MQRPQGGIPTISMMSLAQRGHDSWPSSSSYHSLWQAWQKTTVRLAVASRWPGPALALVFDAILLEAWLRWLAAKAVRPRPATRPASRNALEASLEILTDGRPRRAGYANGSNAAFSSR